MKPLKALAVVIFISLAASLVSTSEAKRLDLSRLLVIYLCDEGSGEVLKDSSGNGWDAKVPKAKWEEGVFGKAVRMQRTNSEVTGDIISSTFKTHQISIMTWFNMAAHSTYNGLVSISHPSCDASCCYRLMVNPARNPFWNAGQHVDQSLGGFTFQLNKWYHYAMVIDEDVTKIYVNGEFIGEQPKGFPFPEYDPPEVTLYVGTGEKPGVWTVEDCAFDEVMVWDKALDEDEIRTVMEGYKTFASVNARDKLAAVWGRLKVGDF